LGVKRGVCSPDWFSEASKDKGGRACIPGRKQRRTIIRYDKRRYKKCDRIEIMFGRIKNWRRVETRYYRCPKIFLSAIASLHLSFTGYNS